MIHPKGRLAQMLCSGCAPFDDSERVAPHVLCPACAVRMEERSANRDARAAAAHHAAQANNSAINSLSFPIVMRNESDVLPTTAGSH